jgi:hypothetical protein
MAGIMGGKEGLAMAERSGQLCQMSSLFRFRAKFCNTHTQAKAAGSSGGGVALSLPAGQLAGESKALWRNSNRVIYLSSFDLAHPIAVAAAAAAATTTTEAAHQADGRSRF